ncbi:MAG TPA: NAD(P)-dependent oxidoreductase, partial [Thermomicrobiales bacterium]|nr:NAD(P)-dependent oxidoreductase [Thermomicrobiales bacterium]
GAAGRIGTGFVAEYGDRYDLRLADRPGAAIATTAHETVTFDIADLAAFLTACAGIDVVLHLAADPSPEAEFYDSLLDSNIKGTFNAFRAARDAGCRRVIFASSIHAVGGYDADTPISDDRPVKPLNLYGASKTWGESLAHVFAHSEGLSSIAVRIGAYEAPWIKDHATALNLSAYISPRDLNQLFVRAIEIPDLPFAIVHGISNNRVKRMDLTGTIAALGYDPVDDGFAIYGEPITS